MEDGARPDGLGGWKLPTDFVCIVGVHADGSLDIADNVTNARDCIYLNKGTMNGGTPFDLTSMTSSAQCTAAGGAGNDGAAHSWTTSFCADGSGYGLSLKGLDRTSQMCQGIGGTWVTSGKCVAYGRQFKGQDANGTPLAFGAKGTSQGAGTGYCYAKMNMTTAYGTSAACPSSSTNSSLAYDWSWSSSKCIYNKGIAGYLSAALTKANGTTYAAGSYLDLSAFTTMGDCLANGGSWSNWTGQAAAGTTGVATTPLASTIPNWNYSTETPDADSGCLHCHSSTVEYNGPSEREKDSYLQTGHKNMLRKVTAGIPWAGPDGQVYTADTAGHPFNWTAGTVGGQALYYIFGDWMAAAPNAVGPAGDYPTYNCGSCHTTGFQDNTNTGVQRIGMPGYTAQQPTAPASNYVTVGHKWDLEGIQCARCHNASLGPITRSQISAGTCTTTDQTLCTTLGGTWSSGACSALTEAYPTQAGCEAKGATWTSTGTPSSFPTTHPTSGGMGTLANGTGRTNLCFGCHQSIAKDWPAGTTTTDPTKIPTGVSHGSAWGRDFNGHVLGNSFLNSPHARYTGTITLNSLGKYDLSAPEGKAEYDSLFQGFTCWQSATSSSPARTKADGSEITNKTDCETLYGAGAWRSDGQGTCVTCHDVHNSLFVTSQAEKALRKNCINCHSTAATDYKAAVADTPQVSETVFDHPRLSGAGDPDPGDPGTPFDTTSFGGDPCAVCHMALQAVRNGNQTSMAAHLWRINTDAAYDTFPTADQFNATNGATKDRNAQTAPDGTFTKAVWVDLDLACGQCHGGTLGAGATANSAPYFSKAQLSVAAQGMHVPNAPPSGDCTQCHDGVTYKKFVHPATEPSHYEQLHGSGLPGNCQSCHAAGPPHDDASVLPTAVDTCQQCHGASGAAHLFSDATAASKAVSQHDLAASAPDPTCGVQCHSSRTTAARYHHPLGANTPGNPGTGTCETCHQNSRRGVVPTTSEACNACHGPSGTAHLFDMANASFTTFAATMHTSGQATYSTVCTDCHSMTVAHPTGANTPTGCASCHVSTRAGVKPTVTAACLGCHGATGGASHKFTADQLTSVAAAMHGGGAAPTCTTCHAASKPTGAIAHPGTNCTDCHTRPGVIQTVAQICNPCHGGSAGPAARRARVPYMNAATLNLAYTKVHKNVAPKAAMTLSASSVRKGSAVTVTDTSTDANGNLATTRIAWGDGSTATFAASAAKSHSHTYGSTGVKTIVLTATDAKGLKTSVSRQVTVRP